MLGAQKLLRIFCCTPSVGWLSYCGQSWARATTSVATSKQSCLLLPGASQLGQGHSQDQDYGISTGDVVHPDCHRRVRATRTSGSEPH